MTLTQITKIRGPGIHTTSNIVSHNINSSGIITAVAFKGPFTGSSNIQSGILTATKIDLNGDIDVDGHTNLDNVSIAGVTTTAGLLDINAGGQANTFKVEDLTDNRVVIAGTGGELESSTILTDNGSTLAVTGGITATTGTFSGNVSIGGTLTYEDVTNIDAVGLVTARNGLRVTGGTSIFTGNTTFNGTNTFAGNSVVSGNYFDINDGKKLRLGTNGDCAFYYNGSATLIETGNKIIHMQSDASIRLQRNSPQQHMLVANAGGSVDLYHSGTQRFETTNTGAVVTGILTATSDIKTTANLYAAQGHFTDHIYIADTIVHTGDTNTKIRFPTNDNITFETAGDERLRIASNGKVGIGTDNPSTGLDLRDDTSDGGFYFKRTNGTIMTQIFGDGTGTNARQLMYSGGAAKIHLNTAGISYFNGGNVGINENNPTSRLVVDAGTTSNAGACQLKNDSTSAYATNDGGINNVLSLISDGTNAAQSVGIQFSLNKSGETGCISEIGATRESNGNSTLVFRTRDSSTGRNERVRITSSGVLLVGKTTTGWTEAGVRMDSDGAITSIRTSTSTNQATANGGSLSLVNYSATDNNFSHIAGYNSNSLVTSQINFVNTSHSSRTGDITFRTHDGSSMPERLRIHADGEVEIKPAAAGQTTLSVQALWASSQRVHIATFGRNGNDVKSAITYNHGTNLIEFGTTTNHAISLVTNNSERLRILTGGHVNINGDYAQTTYTMKVTGSFAATTKSFVIDHPTKENHQLRYACLEGPENSVYVRGRSSDSVIELPDYWVGLVHDDSITVNVTPIGNKKVWVESINNNSVTIGSDDSTEYFYTVFAERKDVEKLEVEVEN